MTSNFVLVIHGGAGNITPQNLPPDQEQACRAVLKQVLETGYSLLSQGGRSLDVVEAAVRMLEDSPLFNAGKGACLTHEGGIELDASIMDGRTLNAGAIAGVTTIRNPVSAARAVMERSSHVLLIGSGAEEFACEQGLELVEPAYFQTAQQVERWEESHKPKEGQASGPLEKLGTVGAVALDGYGDLAAATSTGGMMNKRYGRVGDSPIVGAGVYANNATCAVSSTGHGEHFLCNVVAYDISALMEYKGMSVREAAEEVVMNKLVKRKGFGGVIAVSRNGQATMTFNAAGMYRGHIDAHGVASVDIFKEVGA